MMARSPLPQTGGALIQLLVLPALAACGPAATPCPACDPAQVTVVHTREVKVVETVVVTVQVPVTEIVHVEIPVTVTPTPTPRHTPTPSLTPTITPTPTETPTPTPSRTPTVTPAPTETPNLALTATAQAMGVLAGTKTDGFYLVGVDIAPGKWESTGSGAGCYWARYGDQQQLLDNHFGLAGGTVNVRPTDYEIEFNGCGRWIWVENRAPVLDDDATAPKGDGFYTVGIEIAPGRWRSTGQQTNCYWSRLDGNQRILDNHFGLAGGTVLVRPTDYEVFFSDCGMWEYLGQ